jgi:hydrolase, TatD family
MIDTHCHLDEYEKLEEIQEKMKDYYMITSSTNRETNEKNLKIAKQNENIYVTVGFHPECVESITDEDLVWLEKQLKKDKVVAIGEIGLDYYYTKENKEKQQDIFKKQIELAKKYKKTIVVHSREATEDTYNILEELDIKDLKVVLHCYSSSVEMAKKFLKFNMMFGISGVVTFKNGTKLRKVVEEIDIKHLLLETDSPYLSPEPNRGKRNEPYNIKFVAMKIAEIKKIPLKKVLKTTLENAVSQFDLPLDL